MALVDQDQEHLQILTYCHYAMAILISFIACFPIIHLVLGILMVAKPEIFGGVKKSASGIYGLYFRDLGWGVCFDWLDDCPLYFPGGSISGAAETLCVLPDRCGNQLHDRSLWDSSWVFTLIVLVRPSVKALFAGSVPQSGL